MPRRSSGGRGCGIWWCEATPQTRPGPDPGPRSTDARTHPAAIGRASARLLPRLSSPRKRGPITGQHNWIPAFAGMTARLPHHRRVRYSAPNPLNHPAPRKGRALPRAGAATPDRSTLSLNPSPRSSAEHRCKGALPRGREGAARRASPLIPGQVEMQSVCAGSESKTLLVTERFLAC